jgi:2-haloacid dehalogenase
MNSTSVKALAFDVFGTVVDWYGSIALEGEILGESKGITNVDWGRFASAWRGAYRPSLDMVRTGEMPWTNLDELHRIALDRLLDEFDVDGLTEAEKDHFNRVWHRLEPWPDATAGLARLRKRFIVTTLSNGNMELLADLADNTGIRWHHILSAEQFKHYKYDHEVYHGAAEVLGLSLGQIMLVATHKDDLRVGHGLGMMTAFVHRPAEFGPDQPTDGSPESWIDLHATDFLDLAGRLGA